MMNVTALHGFAALHSSKTSRVFATAIACVVLASAWFSISGRVLLNPDEGRYAEIPREMVASGDWLTPRLNDLKYFEKPPLQYWATAVAYRIFGVHEFTSRLWCGLAGLGCIALTCFVGARLFNTRIGILAALLLAGSWMHSALGHFNTLDMGLSFFLNASLGAFLLAQNSSLGSKSERNWMLVAWTMAALGLLSKGLIAIVLPGLTLIAYGLVARSGSTWRRLHVLPGSILFTAIGAPWFIAVSIVNTEFLQFFFLREHLQRFFTQIHDRVQPWWFFLPLLIVGTLPWATLVPPAFVAIWRARITDRSRAHSFNPLLFVSLWVVVIVVFFSLSQSKLPPYILPVMPGLALIAAKHVADISLRRLTAHAGYVAVLVASSMAAISLITIPHSQHFSAEELALLVRLSLIALGIALTGSIGCAWLANRERLIPAVASLSAGSLGCVIVLVFALGGVRELRSGRDLAAIVAPYVTPGRSIYSMLHYDQSLTFYLRHTVKLVDYRGEMDFGLRQEPKKAIENESLFQQAWTHESSGSIALLPRDVYERLNAKKVPMIMIGSNLDVVAVTKPETSVPERKLE
jgi:4-amino-4-deoxy-L-arabinose transferase-like glycosyltransferase